MFLLAFSVCRLIVRRTALAGTLAAMVSSAAERATQVPATFVPGMSEKADSAMNAANNAPLKLGMGL
jgi:hypothetical protein